MIDPYLCKPLFKMLECQAPDLAARTRNMQARALETWMPLLVPDMGSHSGLLHLINVGRNVEKMLGDKCEKLGTGEAYLLLAAILFHDVGRILARTPTAACADRTCDLPDPPCMVPGWDHHQQSWHVIKEMGYEFGLPDDMTKEYCAILAYCHQLPVAPWSRQQRFPDVPACEIHEEGLAEFRNTSIEPFGPIRIPLLAAILRIADETENHWNRAYTDHWLSLCEVNRQEMGKARLRRQIEDVVFHHAGECIIMHLAETGNNVETTKRLAKMSLGIESVLQGWQQELRPLGLSFKRVFCANGGRLWRYECENDVTRPGDQPMTRVLREDEGRIQALVGALSRLSNTTLKYRSFPWASVEAEVGTRLVPRDRWLVELMAGWVPGAITVDCDSGGVTVDDTKLSRLEEHVLGVNREHK